MEVETEGERWVYDIRDEEHEDNGEEDGTETPTKGGKKGKKGKEKEKLILPSWEGVDGSGRRGEWRRRRWVRMVKRKVESRHGEPK